MRIKSISLLVSMVFVLMATTELMAQPKKQRSYRELIRALDLVVDGMRTFIVRKLPKEGEGPQKLIYREYFEDRIVEVEFTPPSEAKSFNLVLAYPKEDLPDRPLIVAAGEDVPSAWEVEGAQWDGDIDGDYRKVWSKFGQWKVSWKSGRDKNVPTVLAPHDIKHFPSELEDGGDLKSSLRAQIIEDINQALLIRLKKRAYQSIYDFRLNRFNVISQKRMAENYSEVLFNEQLQQWSEFVDMNCHLFVEGDGDKKKRKEKIDAAYLSWENASLMPVIKDRALDCEKKYHLEFKKPLTPKEKEDILDWRHQDSYLDGNLIERETFKAFFEGKEKPQFVGGNQDVRYIEEVDEDQGFDSEQLGHISGFYDFNKAPKLSGEKYFMAITERGFLDNYGDLVQKRVYIAYEKHLSEVEDFPMQAEKLFLMIDK